MTCNHICDTYLISVDHFDRDALCVNKISRAVTLTSVVACILKHEVFAHRIRTAQKPGL